MQTHESAGPRTRIFAINRRAKPEKPLALPVPSAFSAINGVRIKVTQDVGDGATRCASDTPKIDRNVEIFRKFVRRGLETQKSRKNKKKDEKVLEDSILKPLLSAATANQHISIHVSVCWLHKRVVWIRVSSTAGASITTWHRQATPKTGKFDFKCVIACVCVHKRRRTGDN